MPDTETIDRLYLEWSQFTRARNARELMMMRVLAGARNVLIRAIESNVQLGDDFKPEDHETIKQIDGALAFARSE